MKFPRTSQYLLEFLNDFDRDARSDSRPLQELLEERQLDYKELMNAVEGVCTGTSSTTYATYYHDWVRQNYWIKSDIIREFAEMGLDDCYCRSLLKQIPTMVSRALRLDPVLVNEYPKGPVNIYLREATRSYLLGLFIASVALSRSALEQALEEKVPKLLQTDYKEKLQMLINAAGLAKLLQGDVLSFAHRARIAANKIVHGQACKESEAFDILITIRKVVGELYASRA